jgi:hypothetical protein
MINATPSEGGDSLKPKVAATRLVPTQAAEMLNSTEAEIVPKRVRSDDYQAQRRVELIFTPRQVRSCDYRKLVA